MIYFSSDLHLNDEESFIKNKRPGRNVSEYTDYVIKRWNKIIRFHDTVYILGDVGDPHLLK